ncbi:uncharacterized protein I303_107534 [Kwoniella dejecticola CBS 10117]|uniref:Phosphatidylinositol transfer protein SFH5 n=1 Tax=Kwoniella dejecticola CBS 10117 TaxID=1296121 RepID=A0A1A5ZZZ1_9TREE|nr:phosphatidylinositol transfer protein SFH5 [Kwoniella dejecticola CBS 10117]OBR83374.1 phosphatidylinositol transfer protein SFH5 [Kwoniella dejecticola CBS 10117]
MTADSKPTWPALAADHPLLQLHSRLPTILEQAEHSHIWGVHLSPATPPDFGTLLILQKYLRSVADDVDKAAENLTKTLKWRKEFGLDNENANTPPEDFGPDFIGLGYVTKVGKHGGGENVVTWNVYGAVQDIKKPFGDHQRFLRWRIGLMERAITHLHLSTTSTPIPDYGKGDDPHRIDQVHLYGGVSFLRMDPLIKAASKATIEIMQAHYPELLLRKFFVEVPLIMSWMFSAVSLFVSAETAKKFQVISYKQNLGRELGLGRLEDIPQDLGGTGPDLPTLEKRLEHEIPPQ